MKLDEILGYATIKTNIKVQNFETKKVIYEGLAIKYKDNPDLMLSYFKVERDCIIFMVYEKEC